MSFAGSKKLIVLDPELRYRADSVCYHPRIGYFTVSETWIDLLDLWDCKSRNMTEVACSATTLVIANRLIELKLARDTGKPIDTKRKRPLPYLGDGIVAPLDAEIDPTYRCNHKCTFCRVIKTGKARQYNMDAWDAESIIRLETMFDDVAGESRIKIHTGLPFRLSVSPDNQRAPFYMKYGNRCDADIRGLYVAPSGDVYPCELLAREKYKLGNLLSDEWPEFLRSSPVLSFLRTLQSPESCMDCNYFHICRGGCPGLQAEDETKLALPMLHCPFANSSRKRTELEREREK